MGKNIRGLTAAIVIAGVLTVLGGCGSAPSEPAEKDQQVGDERKKMMQGAPQGYMQKK